ncbi:MAG TPA: fumarylacetoacetate hydrolase family protein [Sphingomonas sp.]|nr:fumarylacetoacetate hydrolase family protein [Sphingomonas sp.]
MRLATLADGTRDGALIVVSDDSMRYLPAKDAAATMQAALDDWPSIEPHLQAFSQRLETGEGEPLNPAALLAPLPRAWQWLDGSAFPTHGELMQRAFDSPPHHSDRPLMYQGMSHRFLSATQDVPLPSEADGIDFEGEFGVITDDVLMGCAAAEALAHVRLIVMINDWSLRTLAPIEMKTGFGWIQAKPACSVAPFAITPDALGDDWRDGRVCLPLRVEINGEWFGNPNGAAMAVGFHDLIAHAAHSRDLPAGTIIGSGTVSNADHQNVGSTCLSERRAIEMIDHGTPRTPFLSFGDRVTMGAEPFGRIDQQVIAAQ